MVAGMGYLRGLCPQPEELALGEVLLPFGLLPSQVQTQDDWDFLISYDRLRKLQEAYELWNRMVAKPDLKITMPTDLIQYMLALMEEAEQKWPTPKR
jgi:hypothetical protein